VEIIHANGTMKKIEPVAAITSNNSRLARLPQREVRAAGWLPFNTAGV
jgi:hypothetical protein